MKNNIDEDIKIVENYLKESAINKQDDDFFKNVDWEMIDLGITRAISNVLKALKSYREDYNHRCQLAIDRAKEIEKLKSELETYKKIAEKSESALKNEGLDLDIDWARKEVEKTDFDVNEFIDNKIKQAKERGTTFPIV